MKNFIKKLKKIKNYPLLVSFFGFIFIFTIVDIIMPDKTFSELENKYLQLKPEFDFAEFVDNEFVPEYEQYVNEQFVLRDSWIDLKSRTEYYLGKVENNGIVYGDDGYMFDKIQTIDEERANKNLNNIETFIKTYSDANIKFALIPNSFEVLEEKLPIGLELYDQKSFIEDAYERYSIYDNVETLDLLETFNSYQDEYIYYKTDHHWTTLGAYYAYCEFIESIGEQPTQIDDLDFVDVESFYGTYFSKAKKHNASYDTIKYLSTEIDSMTFSDKEYTDLYDYEKFEIRDKYAAFLYGNNDLTVIKSSNAAENEEENSKVLLIKDSFGNSFAPYLTLNYDEVYVLDLRSNTMKVSEIMETYSFDDVLIMYSVENFINDVNIVRATY